MNSVNGIFKNVVPFVLALTFSHALTGQTSDKKSFEIAVTVENLKVPAKLILTLREISQWVEYTSESKEGRFILSGMVKEPSFAYLVMKYGNEVDRSPRLGNICKLFIENSSIKIHAKDSLRSATIQGGPVEKELEMLNGMMRNWESKKVAAVEEKETTAALEQEKKKLITQFVEQHPNSFVSLYALQNYSMDGSFTIDAGEVGPLFKLLTPQIRNTLSGKALNRDIVTAQRTAMGSQAPDFVQQDTLGRPVGLSSFRGKYVLIDFWASWCKPCRAQNPALVKTYLANKGRNFTILGISLDNNKSNWLKAIRKDQLAWTHLSDLKFWKNEVALLYGVKTVPQNYLIDPTGKIIGKNIRIDELSSRLKEILP